MRRSLSGAIVVATAILLFMTGCGDSNDAATNETLPPASFIVDTVAGGTDTVETGGEDAAAETTATASGTDESTASTAGPDTAVAPAATGPESTAKPQRIVSLSPTATEMLYAIGAGPQVIAVDDQSNFPAEAPKTDLSGFQPNIEAIAAKQPDLVIVSNDTDGMVAKLAALKITTLVLPSAAVVNDSYTQMEQLGAATGNVGGAAQAVLDMKTRMDEIIKRVPARTTPLRYFHELDNTLYTATSKTFIGDVYRLVGLENIADPADAAGSGYPQLSAEYIVQQNPDLVFLADTKCCQQNAATFAGRPGFNQIAAVKNGGVVELDDDIASRWGPRTPELLESVVTALAKIPSTVNR